MGESNPKFLGTVLVTGGAGIVGSFVVEELAQHTACQRVVATYHSKKANQHHCSGVEYRVIDITSAGETQSLLDEINPDVIVHTVSPGPFALAEIQHKVNFMATKELIRQAKAHPTVQAFVYTSSVEAIALGQSNRSKSPCLTEEESILNALDSSSAIDAYGQTKGAADALVLGENTGRITPSTGELRTYTGELRTITLRIASLYGERDLKTMWEMLKCVNTPATRFQIGPDKALHEWVYTANVAQSHILAAVALMDPNRNPDNLPSMEVDGESFFITDDSPMLFWEFTRRIWKHAGDRYLNSSQHPRIIQLPFWLIIPAVTMGQSVRKYLNTGAHELKLGRHHLEYMRMGARLSVSKAKTRLGYVPVCNTEEGIKRSVDWFLKNEKEFKVRTTGTMVGSRD